MGLFGRLFGGISTQQDVALSKEVLGDHRVKLQYQHSPKDPPVKFIAVGTPVTRDVFADVKAMLRDHKDMSVRELAKVIGLGKSTVYRIRAARSYKAYKNDSK